MAGTPIDLALASSAMFNHFVDINKMVAWDDIDHFPDVGKMIVSRAKLFSHPVEFDGFKYFATHTPPTPKSRDRWPAFSEMAQVLPLRPTRPCCALSSPAPAARTGRLAVRRRRSCGRECRPRNLAGHRGPARGGRPGR